MTHKKKIGTVAYYVVGILIAILAIIPFLWMVSTSLKALRRAYEYSDRMDPKRTDGCLLCEGVFKVSVLQHHREQLIYLRDLHVHYVDLGVYGSFCFCKAQVSKG